jgi:hypothetical protein
VEQVPEYDLLFEGFISKVGSKTPIELECEDNMWHLKQLKAPENKLYKQATLAVVLNDLLKDTPFTLALAGEETNIGDFRIINESVAQVLDRLKKDYKINSWFRGEVLHSSILTYFGRNINQEPHVFEFQRNIISDSLDYSRADDVRVGAKAHSVLKEELTSFNVNGKTNSAHKRLEVVVGDTDGFVASLWFYGVKTIAELKSKAEEFLPRLKYEGYRGMFTTFGLPKVNHGEVVKLADKNFIERSGNYFVKGVHTTFGQGGYRQEIEVDLRVDGVFSNEQLSIGV